MKCEYCGADLSIDNEKCPYCNAVNPFYEAHRRDMKEFQAKYANTEREVVDRTKRFTRKTVYITVTAVMALLCVLSILANVFMWEINYSRQENYNKRHAHEYAKQAAQYEENRDYLGIASIMEEHYKYYQNSPLYEYTEVGDAARSYATFLRRVSEIINGGLTYTAPEDYAKRINTDLDNIYRVAGNFEKDRLNDDERYSKVHQETVLNIIDDSHMLLRTYLGIDEETLAQFRDMTSSNRQLVIEDALLEVKSREE